MPQFPDTELDGILARIGKTFETGFEPLEVDGQRLEILQIANMTSYLDRLAASNAIQQPLRDLPLWAKVWPGSMILGRFLRKFSPQGKSLLELGAGMGILAMIAARHGFASIMATDISPQAVDFARANVLRNGLDNIVRTRILDIASDSLPPDARFDIIAASELLYLDELHRPILKFLGRHLAPDGKALFCTDLARQKPRFAKLAKDAFQIQEGGIGLKASDGERHIYNILILEKK